MNYQPEGVLLIDKPKGLTSHDVVARVRRIAQMRQVGHTGTLDPMATGLMAVCLGRATRISQFLVGLDKDYRGTIRLGAVSSTYDAEGQVTEQEDRPLPTEEAALKTAMQHQLGMRSQLPPPHSAVKVNGRKLYEYARNNEPVPQKPREVFIQRFDLLDYQAPDLRFEARVGSGTYIRSMAHDLGIELGCGGVLTELIRTRVGNFALEHTVSLQTLLDDPDTLFANLLTISQALGHLPKLTLSEHKIAPVLHGQSFTTRDIEAFDGILTADAPIVVLDSRGRALSITRPEPLDESGVDASLGEMQFLFKPIKVLARPDEY